MEIKENFQSMDYYFSKKLFIAVLPNVAENCEILKNCFAKKIC